MVAASNILSLKSRWLFFATTSKLALDKNQAEDIWKETETHYTEPHRYYHTLEHIRAMLFHFDDVAGEFENPEAVELAIWFHDIIYEGAPKKDEEESAELCLELIDESEISSRAAELILATITHSAEEADKDCALFLDIDLSILAAEPELYKNYTEWVRAEYNKIPDELFYPGRLQVMESFLKREQLFFAHPDRKAWEVQARVNIAAEIEALKVKVV